MEKQAVETSTVQEAVKTKVQEAVRRDAATHVPMIGDPYQEAQKLFDKTATQLHLDSAVRELLRKPQREFSLTIPVKMDDGSVRIFDGYRVQHNDALGPSKGGIHFHPDQSLDATRASAMWMTWKCAVVGIPMGGGDGSIACDTYVLSPQEQEQLCRGWVRQLARGVGPIRDLPAPSENSEEQHIIWMLDELETISNVRYPGMISGSAIGLSGALSASEATGYGIYFMVRDALLQMGKDLRNASASIQGFNEIAQTVIRLFSHNGGTVRSLSFWDDEDQMNYTLRNEDGVDVGALMHITTKKGTIHKERAARLGYQILPGDAWLEQDVDALIPCARPNAIHGDNVGRISNQVKVIAEGYRAATAAKADEEIKQRGIFLVPDLLAHAGGVTSSYFEQVQSSQNHFWTTQELVEKIEDRMKQAFKNVYSLACKKNLYMRDAAYRVAVERVALACRKRGWL
jgi:glutamate dehydrogenase (NAD(P)+)